MRISLCEAFVDDGDGTEFAATIPGDFRLAMPICLNTMGIVDSSPGQPVRGPTAFASSSTRAYWADSTLSFLPELLRAAEVKTVLVVCRQGSAITFGRLNSVLHCLGEFNVGVFDDAEAGSPVRSVVACRERILVDAPDAVVALGGGSVIDVAKASTCFATSTLTHDVTGIETHMREHQPIPRRRATVVAIPTTAGTGTEVTPYAVLSAENGEKLFGASNYFCPDTALLVPEFVQTVPQDVIADAALDGFSHALEAVWSERSTKTSDAYSIRALELFHEFLVEYYNNPRGSEAATAVQYAANLAGEAFGSASSTACHALSFPLATRFGVTHGHACAMLLSSVARYNLRGERSRSKLQSAAEALDLGTPEEIPGYVTELRRRLGDEDELSQYDALEEDFDAIARGVVAPLLKNNPVRLELNSLKEVLRETN